MKISGWIVGRFLFLSAISVYEALASAPESDSRAPVPDAASLEAAEELVRDVFVKEVERSKFGILPVLGWRSAIRTLPVGSSTVPRQ
jgi:hypothetical protein